MKKVLIIADDLTGATNSASLLINGLNGIPVFIDITDLSKEDLDSLKENEAVIFNTNTRTEKKEYAHNILMKLSDIIKVFDKRIIIKKIDTAYRGNVASELDTIMKSTDRKYSFIINSIPFMNRITVGGFQIINGRFLEDSDFAIDPYEKINSSFIPDILGQSLQVQPGLIRLEEIRRGEKKIKKLIKSYINRNTNIIIFDSVSDEDIDRAVNAATDLLGESALTDTVWTGSLGLIESISRNLVPDEDYRFLKGITNKDKANNQPGSLIERPEKPKKILGISASIHKNSYNQILNAQEAGLVKIIMINIKEFLDQSDNGIDTILLTDDYHISEFIDSLKCKHILQKYITKIGSMLENKNVFLMPEVDESLKRKRVEKLVLKILVKITKELFFHQEKSAKIKRLILVGGETSFYILKGFNTRTVYISGKIENGIDYGLIQDGDIKGRELLIKGGSVGDKESVIKMVCHNKPVVEVN